VAWAGEHGEIAAEIAAFGVAGTGAYGVLSGAATGSPKTRDGHVEAI
jgi:hypothetical protein